MKRSDFISLLGTAGVLAVIGKQPSKAEQAGADPCVLIPSETRGPYPLDLSADATKFRRDITEGRPGVPLRLRMRIVNVNNGCTPIANARVDIWHTDKDGVYSGFQQPGSNTVGQTFMRGIQVTDADGTVQFDTIYPGWYNGRTTHIHFEVYLSSVLSVTSQIAFPDAVTAEVYASEQYAARGQNTSVPTTAQDNVFATPSGAYERQMLALEGYPDARGYDGNITISINAPTSGLMELEPETGGQFIVRGAYPNPCSHHSAIVVDVKSPGRLTVACYSIHGEVLATVFNDDVNPGRITIPLHEPLLRPGMILYQTTHSSSHGIFHQINGLTIVP
jgi:protocatechuate 3,4-dioxygenase beta subunit